MSVMNVITRLGHTALARGTKHAPTILTTVGVLGSVTSTVLAARSTLHIHPVLGKLHEGRDVAKANLASNHDTRSYQKDLAHTYGRFSLDLVKLYGPALSIGAGSVVCIISAHGLMAKREASLLATLAVVERGFAEYRSRVEGDPDVTDEKKLFYKHGAYEIEDTVDQDGKKVQSHTFDKSGTDMYARFFDQTNPNWTGSPIMNLTFLRGQQRYANELLVANGHVFLNEIYDSLGMERTGPGSVVGWTLTGGPTGDNYIDFGFGNGEREAVRRFINKEEASVLLDFNVQGTIWDKI